MHSVISIPRGVSEAAQQAILKEGANLVELDIPYDHVVKQVAENLRENEVLVQDTSWTGYEKIPRWIVDGYSTLLEETDEQLGKAKSDSPALIVAPAGVGSFAQAVVSHYRRDTSHPAVLVVEPENAASVTTSLLEGKVVPTMTSETVMTGLNCGTMSEIAWPVLSQGLDASTTITDKEAMQAVKTFEDLKVDVGPCGAASLGAVRKLLLTQEFRDKLDISSDSVIVLLSTEGMAANPKQ